MRGPKGYANPRGQKFAPEPNEAIAVIRSIPAPIGGWNTRDTLAGMRATDAVVIDNFIPRPGKVELRPGRQDWATGMTGGARAFLPYTGQSAQKLFASTDTGIYDVTTAGAVGAPASTCTSGKWQSLIMTTSGGSFLVACNGVDKIKQYNGTTWSDIDAASTPAITGIATTLLNNLCLFKRRIWFIANNSMTAYYLPVDSIGGAASPFPMGPIFAKGGKLIAQCSWTIDGGNGPDDYFVTVTSAGEMAIYQGTDPASSTTFALVGVYQVGEPIGKNCLVKYGSDVLYLSKGGLSLLSKLLSVSSTSSKQDYREGGASISSKIDGAISDATTAFSANYGWQMTPFPDGNALIVNIPVSEGQISYQFVLDDITKAWCRFTGWDASAFVVFGASLFSCSGTKVHSVWTGVSDSGNPIVGNIQSAYTDFGQRSQHNMALTRLNTELQGSATLTLGFDNDFRAYGEFGQITFLASNSAVWDVSLWGTAIWDLSLNPIQGTWITVPNYPGFCHSFRLQLATSSAKFSWISTDFAIQPMAGIL